MRHTHFKVLLACAFVAATVGGTSIASQPDAFETVFYDDDGNQVGVVGYSCTRGRYRAGSFSMNLVTTEFGPCP